MLRKIAFLFQVVTSLPLVAPRGLMVMLRNIAFLFHAVTSLPLLEGLHLCMSRCAFRMVCCEWHQHSLDIAALLALWYHSVGSRCTLTRVCGSWQFCLRILVRSSLDTLVTLVLLALTCPCCVVYL